MRTHAMHRQKSSKWIKAASSEAPPSPACSKSGITIRMDGLGRWMDNVFIERLWYSVKYWKAYDSGRDAEVGLADSFAFYNAKRHNQGLDRAAPDQVHFNEHPLPQAA